MLIPDEIEQQRKNLQDVLAGFDARVGELQSLLEHCYIERSKIKQALQAISEHFPQAERARPRLSVVGPWGPR